MKKFRNWVSCSILVFSLFQMNSLIFAGQNEIGRAKGLIETNQNFVQQIHHHIGQLHLDKTLKQRFQNYPAEAKIQFMLDAMTEASRQGIDVETEMQSYLHARRKTQTNERKFSLSGAADAGEKQIYIFDKNGLLAETAETDELGNFAVNNLAPDSYFVISETGLFYTRPGAVSAFQPVVVSENVNVVATTASFKNQAAKMLGANQDNSTISGFITGPEDTPITLAIVLAFDATEQSLAGIGISMSGIYQIENLPAGSYILYADSYFDLSLGLMPGTEAPVAQSLLGEYYDNAATPDEATPVIVANQDVAENINFELASGGAISGRITDETGAAVDSVWVVAVRKFDTDDVTSFFMHEVDFVLTASDAEGYYVASGLKSGDYIMRTFSFLNTNLFAALLGDQYGKHAERVLDEYYGNAQSLWNPGSATAVPVIVSETTENIDFELELAGSITGSFVEASDGATPVKGTPQAIVINAETNYPELTLTRYDQTTGSYVTAPLATAGYKVLGVVLPEISLGFPGNMGGQNDNTRYISQYFDGSESFGDADIVQVTAPNAAGDIDFKMVRSSSMQGDVELAGTVPAAMELTIVAFDATSGEMVAVDTYVPGIGFDLVVPPGSYKALALGTSPGLAGTYYGGSSNFVDAATITVEAEAKTDINISIELANGVISGEVVNAGDSQPLPGVLVIVYDASGHALAAGLSGVDMDTGEIMEGSGKYQIHGLRSGEYFLRTYSRFQISQLLNNNSLDAGLLMPPLGMFGDDDQFRGLDGVFYADMWYGSETPISDLREEENRALMLGMLFSDVESSPLSQAPLFSAIPAGSRTVAVTNSSETQDINFNLTELTIDRPTSVTGADNGVPNEFSLQPNYPNPFNPSTIISYNLPETMSIKLQIYNLLGQKVRSLFSGVKQAGSHTIAWNGKNDSGMQVAAGLYFVKLQHGNSIKIRRMLLVK